MPVDLNVLLVAAEVHPLVKTGGLADVVSALPTALQRLNIDVRVLMPAYRGIKNQLKLRPVGAPFQPLASCDKLRLLKGRLPGTKTPLYLIDCPSLYDRPGSPYTDQNGKEHWDNALRFGVLSKVAAMFGCGKGLGRWRADIVHCNDWHCGLTPAYLKFAETATAASIFTIHNLAYQGNFDRKCRKALEIDSLAFHMDGMEFYGHLSFMKSGIYYSDEVTTVSPAYATQIQTRELGCNMDGVLRQRSANLHGILNGIDTDLWNPASDDYLPAGYSTENMAGKLICKNALQKQFRLNEQEETPVLAMLGRMTEQKGWGIMLEAAPWLLESGVQLVLTGEGSSDYESAIQSLRMRFPGQIEHYSGFSEEIAHLMMAGADCLLVPSYFEPCGLVQMYAQRYGTLPIAHRTGGLADTIVNALPATLADGTATGFLFDSPEAGRLAEAVERALDIRDAGGEHWQKLQLQAMAQDWGWSKAAGRYVEIYQDSLDARLCKRELH
jgi:starch synthase